MVHKDLLCTHSRHFQRHFDRPFHKQVLKEALLFTEKQHKRLKDCLLWEPAYAGDVNPFPNPVQEKAQMHRNLPAGYASSSQTLFKQYREASQTANSTDTSRASQQLHVDIITLHEERPSTFNYFVHWLYTQKLDVENVAAQRQETIYAALYALAKRFDVPALRRLCFSKIREYNELFPLTPSLF